MAKLIIGGIVMTAGIIWHVVVFVAALKVLTCS
jgi:hypothetical protein